MAKLKFDIPGLELHVKLSSAGFSNSETKEKYSKEIERLIAELVPDHFKLISNITENNTFAISISRLPSEPIKTYQLNMDIGVFRFLYDGLYIALSHNEIFANLGKSQGTYAVPSLEVPDWNSLDIAMANADDVHFDVDRYNLHEFLQKLCLSFLIRHELRHIANGHIDYLAERSTVFDERSKNGLLPLDNQTLEMDVDSCVFAGMLEGFLNDPAHRDLMPEELQDEKGIFMSLLFALQFLLYCMPSKKVSSKAEVEGQSHPNAYLRYFFSVTTGISLLNEEFPHLQDLFVQTHQENFWGCLETLATKGLIKIEPIIKDFEWTMSEEGFAYANTIWNNWDKWIPILEPYTYLKLALPNSTQ